MNANDEQESENKNSAGDPKPRERYSPTKADLSSGDAATHGSMARPRGAESPAMSVGSMLGPYELLEIVGQGGMGTVYKARQTRLKKIVALKVMVPASIGNDEAQARFDREMEAVGKIDHPNIVRALDAGEFGGMHYLSMEYVEGTDLSKLVKERGPLSPASACKVIRQAAQGLAVAHAAGLVHRDIKPANMLLTKDGRVKLLDLGLARISEPDAKRELTNSGQSFGTPDYMAPEQWEDSHKVDARADLYSLGCTLFFLLTGKAPYAEAESFGAKLLAHFNSPVPNLPSDCSLELVAVYQKLMAKSPAERVASASELVQFLTPLAESTEASDSALAVATVDPGQTMMPLVQRPKLHRKTVIPVWPWLLGGLGIAAALYGISILISQDGTKTDVRRGNEGGSTDASVSAGLPPADLPPIDYTAERKAAQWLAERMTNGFFMVEIGSGQWIKIDPTVRQLPEDKFILRQVQLIPEIDDEGLSLLARCRRITFVTFASNPKLSLAGLQAFTDSAAPTLTILNLEVSPEIQDELVSLLRRKSFPALQQISASDMRTGSAWEDCPRLPSLEILDIPGAPIGDKGLKAICERYPKLKSLSIPHGVKVSTNDLRPLAGLKDLRRLVSSSLQWSEPNIAVLKNLPRFEALAASSPVANPPGSLQKLAPLADKLIEFELFVLAAWDPGPSDDDYETILLFRKLEFLKLGGRVGSPTDDHLARIAKLPSLKKLSIGFNQSERRYTTEGVAAFRKERPDVEVEVDGQIYPTQAN
jgi:serine/threonine protein kinase